MWTLEWQSSCVVFAGHAQWSILSMKLIKLVSFLSGKFVYFAMNWLHRLFLLMSSKLPREELNATPKTH
jgi:hypothetical protein